MLNPDNSELPLQALIREKMTEKTAQALAAQDQEKKARSMPTTQQVQQGASTARQGTTSRSENQTPTATSWSTHAAPPPQADESFRPAPTPSFDALASVYEATKWQIFVDGKPILRLVSFDMTEQFRNHTQFSLRVFYGHLEEPGGYRIDLTKDLPGKNLIAILGTHLQDDHIQFTGIITQVTMVHSNGLDGDIIISGYSPTILLEGGQHRHSFYNKTLEMIAKEVVADLSGKLEVDIQPRYTQKIPYSAQHRESAFTYLCRMASCYGEWLYYDGRKLCLGWPARQHRQTLYYGKHLEKLQMDMQVLPVDTIYTGYVSSQDKVLNMYPRERVDGLSFYGDRALEKAQQMYPNPVKNYPVQSADDMGPLMHVASVNKASVAGNTMILSGTCRVPALTIGTRLKIMMGPQESQVLGEYLITEVSHCLQSGDRYQAHFKAVYGDIQVIPGPILQAPPAETQLAVVRKNDDPTGAGRVRVQFHWQQEDNMSDWIRVASPDAGGGGDGVAKNRGFVLVPEVGDQVFVSFLENNPDKPYVSGSAFHGENSRGQRHLIRTIRTKSGHHIELDDNDGGTSITIQDKSGNAILLDTKGSHITITAPETMTLKAKNIQLIAEETIASQAGKHIRTSARGDISQDSGRKTIIASGDNTEISASKDLDLYGKKQMIGYSDGKVDIGAKDAIHVYGSSSLITAKDKIEYKAPSMNKLAESGKFKYDKEKQIISVEWMDDKMENEIQNASIGDKVSLLVQTRNYEEGERINLIVDEAEGGDLKEGTKELTLSGIVKADGSAQLKEEIEIEKIEEQPKGKTAEDRTQEEDREVYKTSEGYPKNEDKKKGLFWFLD